MASAGYARKLDYGTSAPAYDSPALNPTAFPEAAPQAIPVPQPIPRTRPREEPATYSISLLAIVGAVVIFALMVFTIMSHVGYTGIMNETVSLNSQFEELTEQERQLRIAFENVLCMNTVEQRARDELGMSEPSSDQMIFIDRVSEDRVEIAASVEDTGVLHGFGAFISSLLEYFR